jgi:hypothetical protein
VALIVAATLLARGAERLTGATSRPNKSIIGDACESEGVAPPSDAGEEVALIVAPEVVGLDFGDASLIDFSGGDQILGNQVAEPLGSERVNLVVIRAHASIFPLRSTCL